MRQLDREGDDAAPSSSQRRGNFFNEIQLWDGRSENEPGRSQMAKVGFRWSSAIERDASERCLRREKG